MKVGFQLTYVHKCIEGNIAAGKQIQNVLIELDGLIELPLALKLPRAMEQDLSFIWIDRSNGLELLQGIIELTLMEVDVSQSERNWKTVRRLNQVSF
jgi:hypothetical protein